jgi:hypothetical protein
VNSAKTNDLMDGDAFLDWRIVNSANRRIQQLYFGDTKAHPDEWFIALDKFRNMMRQIDTSFENEQNASN